MASKLTWLVEVLGMDKLSTLEQKLRDLDKATSSRTIGAPSAPAAGGGKGTSLIVGGVALTESEIQKVEAVAKRLGLTLQQLVQNTRLFQSVLQGIGHSATLAQAAGAVFGTAAGGPPPVPGGGGGGKPGPIQTALAQLFQRSAGTGISQVPGFSALGGMWTVRPITQIVTALSGLPLAVVAAGFAALAAGIIGAVGAVHLFMNAVRDGARLYDQAAKSGVSLNTRARMNQIAALTGVSAEQLEALGLRGEAGSGKRFGIDQMILAARGAGQGGVAQQLMNERWAMVWRDAQPALIADENILANMAKQMKEIDVLATAIGEHFKGLRNVIASAVAGEVKGLLTLMNGIANAWAKVTSAEPGWLKELGKMQGTGWIGFALRTIGSAFGPTATDPKMRPWLLQEPYRPTANRFERLGFVTAPFARETDYAKETAMNTRKIAEAVSTQRNAVTDRINMIKQRHSLDVWAANPNANHP